MKVSVQLWTILSIAMAENSVNHKVTFTPDRNAVVHFQIGLKYETNFFFPLVTFHSHFSKFFFHHRAQFDLLSYIIGIDREFSEIHSTTQFKFFLPYGHC